MEDREAPGRWNFHYCNAFYRFSSASVPSGRKSLGKHLVMNFFVSIWTILLPAENELLHWKLSTDCSGSWFSRWEKILKMWNNYLGVSKFTVGLCSSSIIYQWGTMLIHISAFSAFNLIGCLVRIKSRRKVEHADRFPWIMHMVHPLDSSSWLKNEHFFLEKRKNWMWQEHLPSKFACLWRLIKSNLPEHTKNEIVGDLTFTQASSPHLELW